MWDSFRFFLGCLNNYLNGGVGNCSSIATYIKVPITPMRQLNAAIFS